MGRGLEEAGRAAKPQCRSDPCDEKEGKNKAKKSKQTDKNHLKKEKTQNNEEAK